MLKCINILGNSINPVVQIFVSYSLFKLPTYIYAYLLVGPCKQTRIHPTSFMLKIFIQRNPDVHMNFLGLFNFKAPYLPFVLMGFSFFLHGEWPTGYDSIQQAQTLLIIGYSDFIGFVVGHIYYYFDEVYPRIPLSGTGYVILLSLL